MRSIFDQWATIHRNSKALSSLILLLIIFGWAAFKMWQLDNDPMLGVERLTGTVEKVIRSSSERGGEMVIGEVVLEDGTRVRLYFPQSYPAEGEVVPVEVEVYESGENFYSLDVDRWLMGEY